MPGKNRRIDQLQIVSPCSTDWNSMSGGEKKRFCVECNKFVYDFSQMTRQQIEAIVSIHQGRLCARITKRPDGSLLTLETPPVRSAVARRASPVVNAALAAVLGLGVPANALSVDNSTARIAVRFDAGNVGAKTPYGGGEASVSGTAIDPQGAAIPNAVVKLISDAGAEIKTATSSEGEFTFARVPYGAYIMLVEAPNFHIYMNTNVIVDTPYDMRFEVSMKAKQATMVVLGGAMGIEMPSSLLDLYQQSDLIVIARVRRSVVVETDEEMNTKRIKTELRVSERLKGDDDRKMIPYYHWSDEHYPSQLNQGDLALILLRNRESEDGKQLGGYVSAGWENSVIKLDDSRAAIYRRRIEELTAIFRAGDPNPADILDWLIRGVEEPITRDDAVSNLSEIMSVAESQRERENQPQSQSDEEEVADQEEADEEDSDERSFSFSLTELRRERLKLAAAMTQDHKTRLANTLFGIAELSEDDMSLLNLIQELGDERLASYLVSQLRRLADDAPRLAGWLVWRIANVSKDDDLKRLADDYSDNAEYADDEGLNEEEPDRRGSTRKQSPEGLTLAAVKRSARLKDFLKLVEYKSNR